MGRAGAGADAHLGRQARADVAAAGSATVDLQVVGPGLRVGVVGDVADAAAERLAGHQPGGGRRADAAGWPASVSGTSPTISSGLSSIIVPQGWPGDR